MSIKIIIVLILTFIISVIGTLAYGVRIVGVKTKRIAVSFALFNVLVLVSRTSSSIQAPLLTKEIENSIKLGNAYGLLYIFRWILFISFLATICGALLMPSFIKAFSKAVEAFSMYRSIPKIIIHGFSKSGVEQFKKCITPPKRDNFQQLKSLNRIPKKVMIFNAFSISLVTVGVMASLYAGCLNPDLRSTCSTLSAIVNGLATILLFIFIDPYISMMIDDVIKGECSEFDFNRNIIFLIAGQIIGTGLSQFLLVPSAKLIAFVANMI